MVYRGAKSEHQSGPIQSSELTAIVGGSEAMVAVRAYRYPRALTCCILQSGA